MSGDVYQGGCQRNIKEPRWQGTARSAEGGEEEEMDNRPGISGWSFITEKMTATHTQVDLRPKTSKHTNNSETQLHDVHVQILNRPIIQRGFEVEVNL